MLPVELHGLLEAVHAVAFFAAHLAARGMEFFLLVVIVVVAVVFVQRVVTTRGTGSSGATASYFRKRTLSVVEQKLYYRLVKALPDYRVLAQVSLYQLVGVREGPERQAAFNRISRKCVDFVVCSRAFDVVAVSANGDDTRSMGSRRHQATGSTDRRGAHGNT